MALARPVCMFNSPVGSFFLLLLTIQIELLACGQVETPLLAGRWSKLLGTCSGEVVLVSWGGGVLRGRLAW